jgi:prepilin-type N-terminal cleavage/methylation domain-containing protein
MRLQKQKNKAFTLIELLVVIAIIALLLSITMPSLARAKRQAQGVYCQSNLRQMMLAAVVYTETNDGFFPIAYYTYQTDQEWIQYNWDFTVRYPVESPSPASPGLSVVTPDEPRAAVPTVEPGILWQGGSLEKVQQCPSFRGDSNTPYDPYTGYNYNTSYVGHGQNEAIPQPARRDRLGRPSAVVIFGDGQTMDAANKFMRAPQRSEGDFTFSGRWAGTQGFRHNRRTNTAQGDGSTATRAEVFTDVDPGRYKQTLDEYNQKNPNAPVGFLSPDNAAYKTR